MVNKNTIVEIFYFERFAHFKISTLFLGTIYCRHYMRIPLKYFSIIIVFLLIINTDFNNLTININAWIHKMETQLMSYVTTPSLNFSTYSFFKSLDIIMCAIIQMQVLPKIGICTYSNFYMAFKVVEMQENLYNVSSNDGNSTHTKMLLASLQ